MIEPEQLENGGMQVMHVDRVFHRLEAELIGGAVDLPALDASAGQPDGESPVIVIASVDLAGIGARLRQFDGRRSSELAAADHERFFEQAESLEVAQQRADGSIALAGQSAVIDFNVIVVVPGLTRLHARVG